ncbi:hypothetical protein EOM89_04385 [Candidatus Falkowbacteria bacterium]|nr:hypothetical protein [Candidatus Falkowbacteria bacterium]
MPLCFAPDDTLSKPLFLVPEGSLPPSLRPEAQAFAAAQGFTGALGQVCVLPDAAGGIGAALFGWGTPAARARGRFHLARAAEALPEDDWHLEGDLTAPEAEEAALAWLLAGYRFARYKAAAAPKARLKCPAGVDARRMETIAAAEALTRDLINTPASDMGPEELETAFFALAARHGAQAQAICGDDLLAEGLPMIHAVGRASPRAPRLLDLHWGDAGPRLTLVGKGVCFDTGGLDLKPSSSMGLMKKDMGGAATVMGLAVLAGLAYGQLPAYLAQPYLQSGHLQAVLTEQAPDPWQLFIYRPQQGPVPPRVRLVFDHLRDLWKQGLDGNEKPTGYYDGYVHADKKDKKEEK